MNIVIAFAIVSLLLCVIMLQIAMSLRRSEKLMRDKLMLLLSSLDDQMLAAIQKKLKQYPRHE